MIDETEPARRKMVAQINGSVQSNDEDAERKRLETEYGQVWNTEELGNDFEVRSFLAPFISVTRKSDGAKGAMQFQHSPRFYFNFKKL